MSEKKRKKKPSGCLKIFLIGIILWLGFGIVVYNVHTSGMKKALEKVRHEYVAKDFFRLFMIIKSEENNCVNGSKYLINNLVLCKERTPKKIITALIKTLEINNSIESSGLPNKKIIVYDKNTYFPNKKTLRISKNYTLDEDEGYISLSSSGSNVIIKTCNKTPCNNKENQIQESIKIN